MREQITRHFTLSEFTRSATAARKGIPNALPDELWANAVETCEMLERVREHLSNVRGRACPIHLLSGFRGHVLNRAVGGADASFHLRALAADLVCPSFGTPYQVARELAQHIDALRIGQVIHEFGQWVHLSAHKPPKALSRIITISRAGTEVGIKEV